MNEHTSWIQAGALGILGFLVVTGMSLFAWFVKHITPKMIEAFNENVKLQKIISENLIRHGDYLKEHDTHVQTHASNIINEIRNAKDVLVDRIDTNTEKLDRLLDRGTVR